MRPIDATWRGGQAIEAYLRILNEQTRNKVYLTRVYL